MVPSHNGDELRLRRADFSLSEEQQALQQAFHTALERSSPIERVETAARADPPGYDEKVWRQLVDMRAVAMGVPEAAGGDGAELCELVLVAEEYGSFLTPAPLIEALVTARLLARADPGSTWLRELIDGNRLATVALHPHGRSPQLVAAGAVADAVVGLVDDELVLVGGGDKPAAVANHGAAPIARWDLGGPHPVREVLATGAAARDLFDQAVREWKLLTAAALVGLADGAERRGVDFAINRIAFGSPIATFQAVSHPLVDVAMAITGTRRLVWKAAWYADHEPEQERQLVPAAYLAAVETAMQAATVGVHVQGGLGFTVESDQHLYFRRVKGWTLVAGDPTGELDAIATLRYGPGAEAADTVVAGG